MNVLLASLAFPFRGPALMVNLIFGVFLGVAVWGVAVAGPFAFFMLPALLILGPWFLKYCLLTVRHAAYGRTGAPDLSIDQLSPFESQPVVLAVVLVSVAVLLERSFGADAAMVGVALLTPAAAAGVAVEERTIAAVDPMTLARYAVGLGWIYPVLVVAWSLAGWATVRIAGAEVGAIPAMLLAQSVVLATCHGMGRLLLDRADAIGYERPDTPQEQQARQSSNAELRERERQLLHWYVLAEAGKAEKAFEEVQEYLADYRHEDTLYRQFMDRMLTWPEPTIGLALARAYAGRLMAHGRRGEALRVFARAYAMEPSVRPSGERMTLEFVRAAQEAKQTELAETLLEDFAERFPYAQGASVDGSGPHKHGHLRDGGYDGQKPRQGR